MKKLLALFLAIPLLGAPIIIYNRETGKITQFLPYANTANFTNRADVLIITDNFRRTSNNAIHPTNVPNGVFNNPFSWKITNNVEIISKTAQELQAETDAQTAAAEAAFRSAAQQTITNLGPIELRIRAGEYVMLQLVNRERASNGLPAIPFRAFLNNVSNVVEARNAD